MNSQHKLVFAISSRALFDLTESHLVFERDGVEAYCTHQVSNEDVPLEPGIAFNMGKKLLALNKDQSYTRVDVILFSRNSGDTGLRVFNSIKHHALGISRAAFTCGRSTNPYVSAFDADIFFDDQRKHCESARQHVATGHVPSGVKNKEGYEHRK